MPMTKNNLIGTMNAGYTIVKQGNTAVLAQKEYEFGGIKDIKWVAWHYWERGGEVEYGWGRYGSRAYAEECFAKKERGEYSGD